MSRVQLLIEMHRAGIATPERLLEARALDPTSLAIKLAEWSAPAAVWNAVGMSAPPAPSGRTISNVETQRLVDRHLVMAGFPITGIWWAHPRTAGKIQLDKEWDERVGIDCPPWALAQGLPWRVARLLVRGEAEPAFAPLIDLIEGGVHPYGPTHHGFCIVDPYDDHDAVARAFFAEIEQK